MTVTVDTSDRIDDDFSRLLFLHDHPEASGLVNELPVMKENESVNIVHMLPKTIFGVKRRVDEHSKHDGESKMFREDPLNFK